MWKGRLVVDVGRVRSGKGRGWVGRVRGWGVGVLGGSLVLAFSEFKRDSRESRIYAQIKKVKVSTV